MVRIGCLSLLAFVWRFAWEFHNLTLTALWLLHYGHVVLRHRSPLLHGFRNIKDAISPLCLGRRIQAAGGGSAYQDALAMMPLVEDNALLCMTLWLSTSHMLRGDDHAQTESLEMKGAILQHRSATSCVPTRSALCVATIRHRYCRLGGSFLALLTEYLLWG